VLLKFKHPSLRELLVEKVEGGRADGQGADGERKKERCE